MTIAAERVAIIEKLTPHLMRLSDSEIERLVDTGDVLNDVEFAPAVEVPFGQFYAPFDWINEDADIVLIGITPGRHQASVALKALRASLRKGNSPSDAAKAAKQAASFDGDMREIAALLMNRFQFQKLFGVRSCADLFTDVQTRVHYTSIIRYPVLHWQTKKVKRRPVSRWWDYSGGDKAFKTELLVRSLERDFEVEIQLFKKAWLVPFGPTPALALERLVARGSIARDRVLPGINHPSGTQWNRHNCQLNMTDDHSACAPNVGCEGIQTRTAELEKIVSALLVS